MSVVKKSAKSRILAALSTGRNLTVKQARARFGITNVKARVHELRTEGYAIYTNPRRNGGVTYRLGRPSASFIDKCVLMGVTPKGPVTTSNGSF